MKAFSIMKKLLGIIVLGLLLSGNAYAAKERPLVKELINDGTIYKGMTKPQFGKATKYGFSTKRDYLSPFHCDNNTIREYFKHKRAEIVAGGARGEKRDVDGNRIYFVFKNVTKKSVGGGGTCTRPKYLGNGELTEWFFSLEEAENYVSGISKNIDPKVQSDIQAYKDMCTSIGFNLGTEKFGDCVMKLLDKEKTNTISSQKTTTQSGNKIDWGKVAGEFDPKYKNNNKRVCTKRKTTAQEYTQMGGVSEIETCVDQ